MREDSELSTLGGDVVSIWGGIGGEFVDVHDHRGFEDHCGGSGGLNRPRRL